jgi:ribonuclease HII
MEAARVAGLRGHDVTLIEKDTQLGGQLKAAARAPHKESLSLLIDYFLIDGLDVPQKGVKEGDSVCFSIACASIVAKVTRDRMMVDLDKKYPATILPKQGL